MGQRTVLVTAHTGRENALRSARFVAERLTAAGIAVRTLAGEFSSPGAHEVPASAEAAEGAELVIVLGGDGSLLRAAEFSRPAGVPLIGVNLGHVGFLAEAEPDGLADTVDRVVAREYVVEERMTIDVTVRSNGDGARVHLGAERGDGGEGGAGTDDRGDHRGRRPPAVPLGLRRRGVLDPDRVDRVRVLGGRAGGVARGRGAAHGPDQRARAVRPADGGVAAVGARGRADRGVRDIGGGFVVRWSA